jgi:hypothetical protein
MHTGRAHVLARAMFGMACLSPLFIGDGALRARADVPAPYEDCNGDPIAPEDYEATLAYWDWLETSVYEPIFGASAPYPACERGTVLTHEPQNWIVYGEPEDPLDPEVPVYDPTVRETISGHRFTDDGALPIDVQVLRYEKANYGDDVWGDAASLHPSAGLLFAVFSGPEGSVAVLSEVLTLDAQYEPDDTYGCCLPDGTCPLLTWTDCLAQDGTPAPLGPIGDLDDDGCDDACIYPPERYTVVIPVGLLSADDVDAANTYESVLRELAGICSGPVGFGTEPPPGPPERGDVDCSDPAVQVCLAQWDWCLGQADSDYYNRWNSAKTQYDRAERNAWADAAAGSALCAFTGPGVAWCLRVVGARLAAALALASADYQDDCRAALQTYRTDLNACDNAAEAGGCADCAFLMS